MAVQTRNQARKNDSAKKEREEEPQIIEQEETDEGPKEEDVDSDSTGNEISEEDNDPTTAGDLVTVQFITRLKLYQCVACNSVGHQHYECRKCSEDSCCYYLDWVDESIARHLLQLPIRKFNECFGCELLPIPPPEYDDESIEY